ncbi:hypothetical protein ASE03_12135 [Kitasatospora sp. Root187]|nr:hypothetical protein ASC99_13360 [Kitasatospora sp. Root107]KRB61065.1 hypothetical protein ASE03_12135 [Kitasatospora sp. Root187]
MFVAAALMATAACSATKDRTGGEPGGRSVDVRPSAVPSGSVSMPIERFALTVEESSAVDRAKVLLTNECLGGFGLDYRIPEHPPLVAESSRRYGITDREVAHDHGYHIPPPAGGTGVTKRPTEAQGAILFGATRAGEPQSTSPDGRPIPPGGCYGDAEARLDGGPRPEPDIAAATAIDKESFKQSREDATVVPAFRAWSTCMERHGYRYQDPMASVGDRAFDTAEPTQREKDVALADMDCKTETDLLRRWSAVEAEIQTRMIEENSSALNRLSSFQKRKVGTAREVIERLGN